MGDNNEYAITVRQARRLLWTWDPLGLAPEDVDDEVPADEYDDLVAILLSGAAVAEPIEETAAKIAERFIVDYMGGPKIGLDPYICELLAVLR